VKRQSVVFVAPGRVELREDTLPPVGPGQVLVETEVSALSAGTEMLVYRGQMPRGMAVDETIDALSGEFQYPLTYGYAAVGRVVAAGPDVNPSWRGRRVFAFNPHQSHFLAAAADVLPVPDDLTVEAAVLLPNMETAVSFLMDGRPLIGEQVAVVGQGVVGLLTTALLAGGQPASLVTLDAYPLRREWSRRWGATAGLDPGDGAALQDAHAALQGDRPYRGADLVYELSGNPAALDMAIALAGYNGRIVVGSWYGDKRAAVDLGGRFHRDHLQIISSQVSHIAPQWSGRWTKPRRLGVAWDMLRRVRPEQLISHRLPVSRAAEAYRLLAQEPENLIQVVFTYEPDQAGHAE
jgi:2-desacetyl-2-hydroxyethyl bacteriochlorophyllide A dehydrogenase